MSQLLLHDTVTGVIMWWFQINLSWWSWSWSNFNVNKMTTTSLTSPLAILQVLPPGELNGMISKPFHSVLNVSWWCWRLPHQVPVSGDQPAMYMLSWEWLCTGQWWTRWPERWLLCIPCGPRTSLTAQSRVVSYLDHIPITTDWDSGLPAPSEWETAMM